jgi:isoleucyl-tRNA synthetase
VSKALEEARNAKLIGNALEAQVELYVDGSDGDLLARYKDLLAQTFIVSSVDIHPFADAPEDAFKSEVIAGLGVKVLSAHGGKCQRCWRYEETVGIEEEHPGLCARCAGVLV